MTAILPTGTCFDDVLDHQSELFKIQPLLVMRQYVVHGICLIPDDQPKANQPFAHGWVEDDVEDRVYQSGFVDGVKVWYGCDREQWYQAIRVQTRTRYTFLEALKMNWQTNTFGPWEPAYLALCRDTPKEKAY